MGNTTKENLQYGTAIIGLISGIILCFLSFFLNEYTIDGSVLGYLGEWLIFASGVFGFSIYLKTQLLEAESKITKEVEERLLREKEKEEEEES